MVVCICHPGTYGIFRDYAANLRKPMEIHVPTSARGLPRRRSCKKTWNMLFKQRFRASTCHATKTHVNLKVPAPHVPEPSQFFASLCKKTRDNRIDLMFSFRFVSALQEYVLGTPIAPSLRFLCVFCTRWPQGDESIERRERCELPQAIP